MQIIQNIREKGAAIIIVVIALSLIGFILMDSSVGGTKLFGGGDHTTMGKVNGEKIELTEYNNKVLAAEDMQAQRTGQRPSGAQTYQIRNQVWDQMVAEKIFYKEAEKLGISLTPKELSAILLSNDPANPFMQERSMIDPTTGQLDIAKAQEALANIKKFKGEQKEAINQQIIDPLRLSSAVNKYSSLINASAYMPAWMKKADTEAATNFSQISYVAVPFAEINDSTVKVSDEDINAYINKHKELFKQEAGAKISYLTFSQLPTNADSAAIYQSVDALKAGFVADSNAKLFVTRNASTIDYTDQFIPSSKLSPAVKDTLARVSTGQVFGPYVDKGSYVLAKMLGSKQLPDSAGARHILISLQDASGAQTRTDEQAKKLADSLLAVIKAGGDFKTLATQFSADPGSKEKGGDLGTFGWGAMVPEFNDYVFDNPTGSKGVVKTQFGYHIIDVLSQKNFQPAYKVAYLAKEIIASDATINAASLAATRASSEKNRKALVDYAQKNGLALKEIPNPLKENDFAVGQMQDARQLVKWVFENKEGEVSEPFSIGDDFVVATVDSKFPKGTMTAKTGGRESAEALVRNEKKAATIKSKLGATPTLESAAAAYGKQVQVAGADSSITMNAQIINGLGVEPKVIGAAFNKDLTAKASPAITGESGVFVVKVNSIGAKTETAEQAEQRLTQKMNQMRQQMGGWYEGLKEVADIKDSRSKMF